MKRIAIIGSRETPTNVLSKFQYAINDLNAVIVSGNAEGADQFSKSWRKNLQYLPWEGYNEQLGYGYKHIVAGDIAVYDNIIRKLFPWISEQKESIWKLVRRNMCMIAGVDGKNHVDAVYYWAEETNGIVKGGTRYAVDFARALGIPTFNVRYIKIAPRLNNIAVQNKKTQPISHPSQIDVSYPNILGNPFKLEKDTDEQRSIVCEQYEIWFNKQMQTNELFVKEINRLIDIYKTYGRLELFCYCAPKRCHAEIIKRYIEIKIYENEQSAIKRVKSNLYNNYMMSLKK